MTYPNKSIFAILCHKYTKRIFTECNISDNLSCYGYNNDSVFMQWYAGEYATYIVFKINDNFY